MIYVLVIIAVLSTGHPNPKFQEFESKSTCINALNTIERHWAEERAEYARVPPIIGLCVPK